MAYDIFYFNRDGRRLPEMDSGVAEYATAGRTKMLRESGEYAEAIQIDHPARPCHHWNGRAWAAGPFDLADARDRLDAQAALEEAKANGVKSLDEVAADIEGRH